MKAIRRLAETDHGDVVQLKGESRQLEMNRAIFLKRPMPEDPSGHGRRNA